MASPEITVDMYQAVAWMSDRVVPVDVLAAEPRCDQTKDPQRSHAHDKQHHPHQDFIRVQNHRLSVATRSPIVDRIPAKTIANRISGSRSIVAAD